MSKKKNMFKNMGDKIEDLGHDMVSGIKSFSNSVEDTGEKMVKEVKQTSKKCNFKKEYFRRIENSQFSDSCRDNHSIVVFLINSLLYSYKNKSNALLRLSSKQS